MFETLKKTFFFYSLLLLICFSVGDFSFASFSDTNLANSLGSPIVVDYWSLDKKDLKQLRNSPDFVKVINLAFAFPDGKGGVKLSGEKELIKHKDFKKIIDFFQKNNKLVLLSIAGENNTPWNLDTIDIANFCNNIKKLVEKYNLNGVDIDYELTKNRDKLPLFIKTLRSLLPQNKYLITYAGFATGAYGVEGHEHHEWDQDSTKGCDIAILKEVRNEIDWVSVMTYDTFLPNIHPPYQPEEALLAFQDLMGDKTKVLLGIMLGKQDYPKNLIVTSQQVRPWIEFVKKEAFKGVMFFQLGFDQSKSTGEPPNTFTTLVKKILFNSE